MTRLSRPSSSRTLDLTVPAMKSATSFGTSTFSAAAFLRMIATFISRSGGWMSAISPHSNRDRSRSSRVGISFGSASEVTTICFWAS